MTSPRVLILDTTYVLPLFGIDVEELSPGTKGGIFLEIIWNRGIPGFDLVLATTSLLEALFKLNREFRKQQDWAILERYGTSLPTVKESKVVQLFDPLMSPACASVAAKVRRAGHEDVLDCLIASCAVVKKGLLMTEDEDLVDILVENQFLNRDDCIGWTKMALLLRDKSKG
jgi:hypothetical protein